MKMKSSAQPGNYVSGARALLFVYAERNRNCYNRIEAYYCLFGKISLQERELVSSTLVPFRDPEGILNIFKFISRKMYLCTETNTKKRDSGLHSSSSICHNHQNISGMIKSRLDHKTNQPFSYSAVYESVMYSPAVAGFRPPSPGICCFFRSHTVPYFLSLKTGHRPYLIIYLKV